MKKCLVLPALFFITTLFAQPSGSLLDFKAYTNKNCSIGNVYGKDIFMVQSPTGINYLAPLYNAYCKEQHDDKQLASRAYYDNLSQSVSFLGDIKSVQAYLMLCNSSIDSNLAKVLQREVKSFSGSVMVDARDYIREHAFSYRVVMINEAHCNPLHRAFTYSLLKDFYSKGFRYLAMETFNNNSNRNLESLTSNTGYYTNEPVGGELVREAQKLGFKLVAYEDTVFSHNGRQRDSVQAAHLYEVIQKDSTAKILVHAGYGHIGKASTVEGSMPMAYQFKKLSAIEPYCIDQTCMSEGGYDGFSSMYYKLLIKKYPVTITSVLVRNNLPIQFLPDSDSYNIHIIHPPTIYDSGRATWYSLNGEKQRLVISKKDCPAGTFLIQAYYREEFDKNELNRIVPADQTYLYDNGKNYILYLKKGKYKIIFRDMAYKILKEKNLSTRIVGAGT